MTNTPNTWNETAQAQPDTTRDVIIWSPGDIDIQVGFFCQERQQWWERDSDGSWTRINPRMFPTHWMDIHSPEGKPF